MECLSSYLSELTSRSSLPEQQRVACSTRTVSSHPFRSSAIIHTFPRRRVEAWESTGYDIQDSSSWLAVIRALIRILPSIKLYQRTTILPRFSLSITGLFSRWCSPRLLVFQTRRMRSNAKGAVESWTTSPSFPHPAGICFLRPRKPCSCGNVWIFLNVRTFMRQAERGHPVTPVTLSALAASAVKV